LLRERSFFDDLLAAAHGELNGLNWFGMRYLAIDLGDKRTGLAVGDDLLRLAAPAGMLEVPIRRDEGRALYDAMGKAVVDQLGTVRSPGELVVGLPLNMDGTESPRAALARVFAARLGEQTGRRVHLHDERLTTAAADWSLARTGLTHKQKKGRRDAIAAALMLQAFLDALPGDRPVREPYE
jgi:putative Holliday junction resolvase